MSLIDLVAIHQLNRSASVAVEDIMTGEDVPTLRDHYIRQLKTSEAEFLRCVESLKAKYQHAHELGAAARGNEALEALLEDNDISLD